MEAIDKKYIDQARELWPELEWINDAGLKEKTTNT